MPLTGSDSVLAAAIKSTLLADPDAGAVDNEALTALASALASTLLAHIVANAVVNTTGTAAAQVGVIT